MDLTFTLDDEFSVPYGLIESNLTTVEIAAIVILQALCERGASDAIAEKLGRPEIREAINGLKQRNIIMFLTRAENQVSIEIDLTAAQG